MAEGLHAVSSLWLEWVLLHTLQTSLFVLVIWVLDRAIKPSAAFSYLLWLLALVKAFLPPLFPMPWPAPTYPASIIGPSFLVARMRRRPPSHPRRSPRSGAPRRYCSSSGWSGF